jgi:signal peptidase II
MGEKMMDVIPRPTTTDQSIQLGAGVENEGTGSSTGKSSKWRKAVLPVIAILTLAVDQISKYLVLSNLKPGESWNPIASLKNWVSITYVTNTGAAFGLLPEQSLVFIIIAVVVVIAILVYHRHLPKGQWLIKISLGLQLGGALGNLVDRLRSILIAEGSLIDRFRHAYVVDFLDLKIWPVFNLADSAIVLGVVILAYYLLLDRSVANRNEGEPPDGGQRERS